MKKILVLHTGGTISMSENPNGEVSPSELNPLMQEQLSIPDDLELEVEEIFNLPSPHITLEKMLQLKERITKALYMEGIVGVVITHGTDTLEETAFFLDNTIANTFPIVLTGAMRSSNELGTDGLYNFYSALRVAANDKSIGKGVLVVMNDEIHTARFVTKTHTTNVATFRTPTHGPIGLVAKHDIIYYHQLNYEPTYDIHTVKGRVPIIKAYAGMDDEVFKLITKDRVDGIVVEALGAGNLPPATQDEVARIVSDGIPVVLVSRCFNGVAEPVYAYKGGGIQLEKIGVIFSNGVNSQKARIQLIIALNAGMTGSTLKKYIRGY